MAEHKNPLEACTGFEWDEGNARKNWEQHQVLPDECEQVFFNFPLVFFEDNAHSVYEKRWSVLGQTAGGSQLTIIFTVRRGYIRVISARDMSKKERRVYEKEKQKKDS